MRGVAHGIFVLLMAISLLAQNYDPKHHDDAQRLLKMSLPLKNTEIENTVIKQVVAKRPELAGSEDRIRQILDEYLASPNYMETGTQAIMYFFHDSEILQMIDALQKCELPGGAEAHRAILDRYNLYIDKAEKIVADYLARRLTNWNKTKPDTTKGE